MNIRLLNASEIECRVQSVKKTKTSVGCILLLYKDARVDMKLLDETYGSTNWQRTHEVINGNLFCNIEIWDTEKKCWVRKQDVGTESNTEKEKGQASDSFKRAGFNWGIGRELYTSPFIWIDLKDGEYYENGSKIQLNPRTKFSVKSIGYNDNREITSLQITDNRGVVRYELGKSYAEPPKIISKSEAMVLEGLIEKTDTDKKKFLKGNQLPQNEQQRQQQSLTPDSDAVISKAQAKRMYALSNGDAELCKRVMQKYGYEKSEQVKKIDYNKICEEIEAEVAAEEELPFK